MKFDDMVKMVAEMTDCNNHVEALELIIQYLIGIGSNNMFQRLDDIRYIKNQQEKYNGLDGVLSNFRYSIYEEVMKESSRLLSEDEMNLLYSAL